MPSERWRHEVFRHADADSLRAQARELGVDLPWSDDLSALAEPLDVGNARLPNRCVALPMEGFDADANGTPGERSRARYARYAEGGFGLVWVEACAVAPEARTNPGQFWLRRENVGAFCALADAAREAGRRAHGRPPILVLQLTHSGRFSKPEGRPAPIVPSHNPDLDARFGVPPELPVVEDAALDGLPERFAESARLAREAGFDGVDVKACHGYLFGELLAARQRGGRYGGDFENRVRLPLAALDAVRDAVPEMLLASRLGIYDPHPWPWGWGCAREDPAHFDFREPFELIARMRARGLSLVGLTIGNPYYHPHYNRPYDVALPGATLPAEHPLVGVARCLSATREAQEAFADLPMVGFGMAWLRGFYGQVAAGMLKTGGMLLAGQGRGAFAYPESVGAFLSGGAMEAKRVCVTCSRCTQKMREGRPTGCLIRHKELF